MDANRFTEIFKISDWILTEGAIVERLRHEFNVTMDPHINHAGCLYNQTTARIMAGLYAQYVHISMSYNMPIMLMTPTRKVNLERIERSAFKGRNVIADAVGFLASIKSSYISENIFIGGMQGCKSDAYKPETALNESDAYHFHRQQTISFAGEKVDFLFAGIMPALSEAIGMAQAMSESGIPYIISFMIGSDGKLLDGTFLADAINMIDNAVNLQPVCYMVNCIHPYHLSSSLNHSYNLNSPCLNRLKGIQANTSLQAPDLLDNSEGLDKGDYQFMINEMKALKERYAFKILGGCCGTDDVFIEQLAQAINKTPSIATDKNSNHY
jgi:S-methylmethionine-dependent homocysteine/selenocysteine methylase